MADGRAHGCPAACKVRAQRYSRRQNPQRLLAGRRKQRRRKRQPLRDRERRHMQRHGRRGGAAASQIASDRLFPAVLRLGLKREQGRAGRHMRKRPLERHDVGLPRPPMWSTSARRANERPKTASATPVLMTGHSNGSGRTEANSSSAAMIGKRHATIVASPRFSGAKSETAARNKPAIINPA